MATKDVSLISVLVVVAIAGVLSSEPCKPPCSRYSEGQKVKDPTSCNRYYVCGGNGTIAEGPVYCQSGNFNQMTGQCEPGECHPECLYSTMCTPDCSGRNPGEFVEDPLDCTQFYVCLGDDRPNDHAIECETPTGVFDPSEGTCVDGVTCQASCYLHTCRLKCQGPGYEVPYPNDCTRYQPCTDHLHYGHYIYCPLDKPYFNGYECVDDDKECCTLRCNPVCERDDVQIPDPLDCHKYYICLKEGTPDEANHFSCPQGEGFDPASTSCTRDLQYCVPLC